MIEYKNKVALVTGAASGIGAALASQLSKRGASVVCADINAAGVNNVADSIGRDALPLVCDLAKPEAASELVEDVYKRCGALDLICSNAGIGYRSTLSRHAFDNTAVLRLFEINVFAALRLAHSWVQQLEDRGDRGRFLVTASENSLSVPSGVRKARLGFYGASKHALLAAMEWLHVEQEQGPLDIHVLMPGAVYTPLIAESLPDPAMAPPELELIMPEQCADIALRGMDLDLFYIPAQGHLLDDMQPRLNGVEQSLQALGIPRQEQLS